MVTIKEIAIQLGVSPTTVSNVLHGNTQRMSPETKQKIEEALIANHYYRENKKDQGSIPMVIVGLEKWEKENIVVDPFFGEVLGAVEAELRQHGRSVIFSVQENEDQLRQLLSGHNVEGAILVGYQPQKSEALSRACIKPLVFIDSGEGDFYNVGLQDLEGAMEITSYLLKLGHRKIAFLSDQVYPSLTSNARRLEGLCRSLEKFGHSFCGEDYIYLPPELHIRHEILRQFAKHRVGSPYTAGFFVSDLLANEAVSIFHSQGISVPDDISVAGFDDNIYARLSRPMLTTVRQNPSEKGREAVKMFMKRIRGEEAVLNHLELPTELIVRESVKNVST